MRANALSVAIAGATGNVGREMARILAQRQFPVRELAFLASHGREAEICGKKQQILPLDAFSFAGVDVAFFALSAELAAKYAPIAEKAGCTVIDNSSHFRLKEGVPLVVPEVNGALLENHPQGKLIANPNCAAAPLVCVLKPLHEAVGVKRVVVATYQSVSGAGAAQRQELRQTSQKVLEGEKPQPKHFARLAAFNVLPQIGELGKDGRSGEEEKLIAEFGKMLDPNIKVSATCVRVPVDIGHGEAVHIELAKPLNPAQAAALLEKAPGVRVAGSAFEATPLDAAGEDEIIVARLRDDPAFEYGLNFWLVSDNLRKGAALNAVQIAEQLYHQGFFAD